MNRMRIIETKRKGEISYLIGDLDEYDWTTNINHADWYYSDDASLLAHQISHALSQPVITIDAPDALAA